MWCVVKEEEGRIEEEWLFVLFIYIFFFYVASVQTCQGRRQGREDASELTEIPRAAGMRVKSPGHLLFPPSPHLLLFLCS